MTRKNREPSRSPAYFPAKSSASKTSRSRRKTPKRSNYSDNYTDSPTPSQSQQYSYESDHLENDDQQNRTGRSTTEESFNNHPLLLPSPVPRNPPLISSNNSQPTNQFSSYMKITRFPIFKGEPDECPVTHMSRFAKVSRANNVSSIDMMMKIFPVTLENEAALWYDLNIEPYPSLEWEEIKSSFLAAYRKNEYPEQFKSELMMINQGEEETVRSYLLRLQWMLQRWPEHGISDTLMKGIFIDGLRKEFQEWIIPQKPENLEDVLRLALTWEQVRSIRMVKDKDFKCGFCDGAHEEKGCEIRERMRGLWLDRMGKRESDDDAAEEVLRSVSGGESRVVEDEREDDQMEMLGGKKKNQCQCSKHNCWKKSIKSSSFVTRNSINGG